jgi:hypothetical protein
MLAVSCRIDFCSKKCYIIERNICQNKLYGQAKKEGKQKTSIAAAQSARWFLAASGSRDNGCGCTPFDYCHVWRWRSVDGGNLERWDMAAWMGYLSHPDHLWLFGFRIIQGRK